VVTEATTAREATEHWLAEYSVLPADGGTAHREALLLALTLLSTQVLVSATHEEVVRRAGLNDQLFSAGFLAKFPQQLLRISALSAMLDKTQSIKLTLNKPFGCTIQSFTGNGVSGGTISFSTSAGLMSASFI